MQPKFKDKDLKYIAEFEIVPGIEHYNAGWNAHYGSACIEEEDDTHCGKGLPIPRGLGSLGGVGIPMPNSGLTDLCHS